MLAMLSRLVLRYHRLIGLVALLPVVFWGLSGLSHPIVTRLQPQPAAMTPPPALLVSVPQEVRSHLPPLGQLLADNGIAAIESARLMVWQDRPVWQLTLPAVAERRYIDAQTGDVINALDRELAIALARHYTGETARDIAGVTLVSEFSDDYLYVNRLLPVWRVEFAGGDQLRAFVETSPLRLATLDNTLKSRFGSLFRNLHSWMFISNETLRDTLMTVFLLAAFFSAVGGLWLYGHFLRRAAVGERARPARRWHRRIGLVAAVGTLMFSASAMLHLQLLDKSRHEAAPWPRGGEALATTALMLSPAQLPLGEGESLQVLAMDGAAVWRLSPPARAMVGKSAHGGHGGHEGHAGHENHSGHEGQGGHDAQHGQGDAAQATHDSHAAHKEDSTAVAGAGHDAQGASHGSEHGTRQGVGHSADPAAGHAVVSRESATANKSAEPERYFAADGSLLADGPATHARLLATAHSGLPAAAISHVEKITRFEGEYGFINKRLPVYRVGFDTPDQLAVFVETVSGVTAAEVRSPQRIEGWSFAWLHKWTFLDPLGKNLRDALTALMALLIVVTVLLGLRLVLRRRPT
ncbi:MAG: PepSY-associated TM helix domain-containing protein [Moraxellaceae bacterium]|nr:PepSY-associated TM helix domain-containing protein [Moraxellaceae bacterium]